MGNNCLFTQILICNFTQRAEPRLPLKLKNGNSTDLTLANTVTNRIQLTSFFGNIVFLQLNLPHFQSPLLTRVDRCAASWARVSNCLIPYYEKYLYRRTSHNLNYSHVTQYFLDCSSLIFLDKPKKGTGTFFFPTYLERLNGLCSHDRRLTEMKVRLSKLLI